MFTGIVEELGEVTTLERRDRSARVTVRAPLVTSDAAPGDSIAVNGVCLTVVDVHGQGTAAATFTADVMLETLNRSSLGSLAAGSRVNLERALSLQSRLGGHLVQGHVDGTGTVLERTKAPDWELVRVSVPAEIGRYLVEKGSVTVDGVSLTVAAVAPGEFTVALIPTTLAATTLGRAAVGDPVNLEVDVLAKYVERLLADGPAPPAGVRLAVGGHALRHAAPEHQLSPSPSSQEVPS